MEPPKLQGWQADPFGLHEFRYFSAGTPTKLVRDGNVEGYDEPPGQEAPATDIVIASSGPWGTAAEARPSQPVTAHPAPAAPAVRPPFRHRSRAATGARIGLVYTTVALTAVVAVLAFVAIAGRPSPGIHAPFSVAAFVMRSAQKTLAQQTADFTIQGTANTDGLEFNLHGSGQTDFATDTTAMNVSTSFSGHTLVETEIVTGQDLYLQVTVDGQSMAQIIGGRQWFEVPLATSPVQNGPQDSAVGSLQMLEQQGARVVSLGAQEVEGRSCDEYSVTPTKQAMLAAAQREWAKLDLPSSEMVVVQQQLNNMTPPTITIWVDPSRQVACQFDVDMQFSTGTAEGSGSVTSTDSVQMLMTFTHYGVPVTITLPSAADTVTF